MNSTNSGPNVQSTIDSINSQIGSINNTASSNLPQINLPKTISSTNLTPQPSIIVTQPNPTTQAAGLTGAIQANTDQYTANLQSQADALKAQGGPGGSSLQDLMSALNTNQGPASLTNTAYGQTVDPAQKELTDINNQIISEQTANRHQIEALKANPQGAFGTGLDQQINQINSQSLSRQADLAVVQMAKQGQYDSAKTIADRAVAAATEAQQNHINALQLSYNANKDAFTTAEQRSFEAAQKTRQDALDEKTYETRAKYDSLIKQQDPLYRAQLLKAQHDVDLASGDPTIITGWVTAIKNGTAKLSDLTANPTLKNQVVAALGIGGSSAGDILKTTKDSLGELQTMIDTNHGFSAAVGSKLSPSTLFGLAPNGLPGSAAADFTAKLNQVKNDVILPNLTLLHGLGRVTDREFQALTSAVTSLSPNQSEPEFKAELTNITQRIDAKLQDTGSATSTNATNGTPSAAALTTHLDASGNIIGGSVGGINFTVTNSK